VNEESQGSSGGGETVGPAPTGGGETVGPAPGAPLPPVAPSSGGRNTPLVIGVAIAALVVLAAIIGFVMR
jgi:hypothetical protein